MQLSSEETLTLQLRRRSFQVALADLRVQGALIVTTPWFAVCPCCGYPTLPSRRDYDICRLCRWLDDGQDDPDSDRLGLVNQDYSLTEARRNFIDGRTMYRATDKCYAAESQATAERDLLIAAYDALLPDVHPWSFIGALKRIDALDDTLRERRLGPRKARIQRDAREDERRRADREWEIWRSVAIGTLPRHGWQPPSLDDHEQRQFQSIATRATELLEERMGMSAPIVAHRGRNYRCWVIGDRSAWMTNYTEGIGLSLDPDLEERRNPIFSVHDPLAPDKIAQILEEHFTAPDVPA